jgi:predicted DNA-binding protein (MmcQ/YjbR family)/Cu/Zn superoxide dismutase
MHLDAFRDYALALPAATEDLPFGPDTLVFKVGGKMFALASLEALPPRVALKCDPERAAELRERYAAVSTGAYLDKRHWNSITLDGEVPDDELRAMVVDSHALVVAKLTRKARAELFRPPSGTRRCSPPSPSRSPSPPATPPTPPARSRWAPPSSRPRTPRRACRAPSCSPSASTTTTPPGSTWTSPGEHGLHIHEGTSCERGNLDADAHLEIAGAAGHHHNPLDSPHGAPDADPDDKHWGDLGNVTADASGVVRVSLFNDDFDQDDFEVGDDDYLAGQAVIIHSGRDDYTTQPDGASGVPVGCGLLAIPPEG